MTWLRRGIAVALGAISLAALAPQCARAGDVTEDQLRRIMPGLSAAKAREYAPMLNQTMREFGIHTPGRQAAFLAQLAQ